MEEASPSVVSFEQCSQAIQSANVSDEDVMALIDKRLGASTADHDDGDGPPNR